jgi:uncharacterized HAD superfamily protein
MRKDRHLALCCDLDGVLGDVVQQVVRFSRRQHGISMTRKHIVSEDIETCAPIKKEQLHSLFHNRDFFRSLPVFPHARRELLNLKELGYEIHIVTDRFWYEGIREDTNEWLATHRIPFDSAVFARKSEKHDVAERLGVQWFIEDQLSNARLLAPLCRVLLLDRPYNQGETPDRVSRVKNLREAVARVVDETTIADDSRHPHRLPSRCPA